MLSEDNDSNMNSSKSKGSLYDELDNYNSELEIKNGIIKFHSKAKEFNMNYELNNNEEIDNGMLINSKNDLVSIDDDEIKESEKNIYLVKNNNYNTSNKNKTSNAQKKDLAENFTIKNLYTMDENNKKKNDDSSDDEDDE